MSKRNLMAGVGSAQAWDRAGWLVAERIQQRPPSDCDVRLALAPADLLDWIQQYQSVHICDACSGDASEPTLHRWQWPEAAIEHQAWSGTHDLHLPGVLQLATTLGMAPPQIVLWGIEIPNGSCHGERHGEHWAAVEQVIARAADAITEELQRTAERCPHA